MKHKLCSTIIFLSFLIIPIQLFSSDIDPNKFYTWQSFEESSIQWTTTGWTNNIMSSLKLSKDYVTDGQQSLQALINAGKAGENGAIQLLEAGDLSAAEEIKLDIYNSSMNEINFNLSISLGEEWITYDAEQVKLKPGWNKDITFNLKNPVYKTGDSNGKYDQMIKGMERVRKIMLVFTAIEKTDGYIFTDNIMIKGKNIAGILPVKIPENIKEVLVDGFEGKKLQWAAMADGSCATSVQQVTYTATEGKASMMASFDEKTPGGNAIFALDDSLDLTDVYEITMDVYNPRDFSMNMTIAFGTGDKWAWQESISRNLKKGWNKDVTFYLKQKTWKNEKTNYEARALPDNLDQVKRVNLVFVPAEMGPGYVLVDNVKFKTTNLDKIQSIIAHDTSNLSFYLWDNFDKGTLWSAGVSGSRATAVQCVDKVGDTDKKGMELSFATLTNVDNASFDYTANMDWSTVSGLKFEIYNPMTQTVQISVAFKIGPDYTWYESKTMAITPGWNRDLFIDLTAPSFKSQASGWTFTEYLYQRNDIRDVVIQVYPNKQMTGKLVVTEIRFARHNLLGPLGDYAGITGENNSQITSQQLRFQVWDDGQGEGTFEKGLGNWIAANNITTSGWGAGYIQISNKFASEGKHSMELIYKDIGNKTGIEYNAVKDISNYNSIMLDLYNPGGPLQLSIAFNDAAGNWNECNPVKLNSGWNKNMLFKFTDNVWGNSGTGNRKIGQLRMAQFAQMYLVINGTIEGAVYVDNIRWGMKSFANDVLGRQVSAFDTTSASTQQDLNLEITPNDFINAKIDFRGAYYDRQNTELKVNSAHLILRGAGNELNLFTGEQAKLFDDAFGLINVSSLGSNITGAQVVGTIAPLRLTYELAGVSDWLEDMYKLGSSYVAGVRLKESFLSNDYIGLLYYNQRRGYDEGANPFTADLEESSHIITGDFYFNTPIADKAMFNLQSQGGYAFYDDYQPVYMLYNPQQGGVYAASDAVSQNISNSPKPFVYVTGDVNSGPLTFDVNYRKLDYWFPDDYINRDYKSGEEAELATLTYIMDEVPPFSIIKALSAGWYAFIRNTQMMFQYDEDLTSASAVGSAYQRHAARLELKNDQSLAIYNYDIYFRYDYEGNKIGPSQTVDTRVPSYTLNLSTKLLVTNYFTISLLGRWEKLFDNPEYSVANGTYSNSNINRMTGYTEIGYKFSKNTKITLDYKVMGTSYKTDIPHTDFYLDLEHVIWGSIVLDLIYGVKPFTGYWLDDLTDDTINRAMVTLRGYF